MPRLLLIIAALLTPVASAQSPAAAPPRVEDNVALIQQTALGAPWAFIGYAITPPSDPEWLVAESTPRGGTMGRRLAPGGEHTAVLVLASELLDKPVDSDAALLELARNRHAKIGERWQVSKHEETIDRHAGTRCARHVLEAIEPEDRSPRKGAAKANEQRATLNVRGVSCVHPTDSTLLVEVGVSERGRAAKMSPAIERDAEQVIANLAFHRYSERTLQKAADAARLTGLADAEAVLKPYVDADAAWARFFLAQIVERAQPPPENLGARLKSLLEPAAERGLVDAQWSLGTMYLRGMHGLTRDPALAEALLRRAAERGSPGAAFQLGIAQLSGNEGIPANRREALLWIQRSAFRGQKEAQELLQSAQAKPTGPAQKPAAPAAK
jgi:hypothetical protein